MDSIRRTGKSEPVLALHLLVIRCEDNELSQSAVGEFFLLGLIFRFDKAAH